MQGKPSAFTGMSLPAQHVEDGWQSAEFWANKVLMEFRNSEAVHVTWVRQLKEVLMKLRAYVQKHHKTGPAWNAAGKVVSSFTPGAIGEQHCPLLEDHLVDLTSGSELKQEGRSDALKTRK